MNIYSFLRIVVLTVFIGISSNLLAQDKVEITAADYENTEIEMADTMRSNGKIYVVVAVIMTIFLGMVAYTVIIDQKVKKLEQKEND